MKQQVHEITVCGIEDKLLESLHKCVITKGTPDIEDYGDCETGPDPSYNGHVFRAFRCYSTDTDFKSVLHEERSALYVKKSQFILGLKEARDMQYLWS